MPLERASERRTQLSFPSWNRHRFQRFPDPTSNHVATFAAETRLQARCDSIRYVLLSNLTLSTVDHSNYLCACVCFPSQIIISCIFVCKLKLEPFTHTFTLSLTHQTRFRLLVRRWFKKPVATREKATRISHMSLKTSSFRFRWLDSTMSTHSPLKLVTMFNPFY